MLEKKISMQPYQLLFPLRTTCIMDVTFFWKRWNDHHFGILSVYSCTYKQVIYAREVVTETVSIYESCWKELCSMWWQIHMIVCDGRSGVMKFFQSQWVPVQMCQFHMHSIIARKIGLYPKSSVGKDLRDLLMSMTHTSCESFHDRFMLRLIEHYSVLNERTETPEHRRKWRYKHERLRSAYMSVLKFLPSLFRYQYSSICFSKCPNTTNHLDGWVFSHLKEKTNLHRWKTKPRKLALIFELLFKTHIKK